MKYSDAQRLEKICTTTKKLLEPVFIGGGCRMGEGFCRPARQKNTGILDILQDFLTRQGGKRPGQTGSNACDYRFLDYLSQEEITPAIVMEQEPVRWAITTPLYNKYRRTGLSLI